MKLATITLKRNQLGSTVTLKRVTPAQLAFLVADVHAEVGGNPVVKITPTKKTKYGKVQDRDGAGRPVFEQDVSKEDGKGEPVMVDGWMETEEELESQLTPRQELMRLKSIYRPEKVNKLYPDKTNPKFPETFEEAMEVGLGTDVSLDQFNSHVVVDGPTS